MRLIHLKLLCQGGCRSGVFDHGAVEDCGEVALEDAHGLASCVASADGVVDKGPGAGFVAELDHGHAVDCRVELAVAPA